MIHRQNWLDVQAYLKYMQDVKQLGTQTIRLSWVKLRLLLEWADEKPFGKAAGIKPTFPVYVEGLKTEKGRPFSAAYLNMVFIGVQGFFTWAKRTHPTRYRALSPLWIETLRASRGRSLQSELHKREVFSLEDVRKLVSLPCHSTADRRNRAGVALLFLSAMRIGALMTLPIECVDLERMAILQLPEKGVHTKNSKAAVTYLLNIPFLLEVVREWDDEVRGLLPESAPWFAVLTPSGEIQCEPAEKRSEFASSNRFRGDLARMCKEAGILYRSPHKLRHGFAVYALKRARTVEQMKAVSQNLMHSNMGITDGIYGRLVDDDVKNIITGL